MKHTQKRTIGDIFDHTRRKTEEQVDELRKIFHADPANFTIYSPKVTSIIENDISFPLG